MRRYVGARLRFVYVILLLYTEYVESGLLERFFDAFTCDFKDHELAAGRPVPQRGELDRMLRQDLFNRLREHGRDQETEFGIDAP